jgi:hypothetical protein
MTEHYGIFEIAKDGSPVGSPILTGLLDECLACISVAQLNEQIVAASHRQTEREQLFAEQSTKLVSQLSGVAEKLISASEVQADAFEKQRALSAKRAEAARIAEGKRRVQQYLDALPDPDGPSQYPEPTLAPDPRSDPQNKGSADVDEEGDLPTELQKDTPPSLGKDPVLDPAELGYPPDPKQVPQPISISLNEV